MSTAKVAEKRLLQDAGGDHDVGAGEPALKKTKGVAYEHKEGAAVEEHDKSKGEYRNYKDSARQDRVEKFYTEQHKKMTFAVAVAKSVKHLKLNKCVMSVWDMLLYLDQVVDDSDPDTELTQLVHAVQTAEATRKAFPGEEYDWLHVAGLVHDLGKILAVNDPSKNLSADPQWCVVGDSFPVGCAYAAANVFPDTFDANPDKNNPKYNSELGVYSRGCGLDNVVMSWGHDEYMYRIAKGQSKLPQAALYILRFHSFYPWHQHGAYMQLCDEQDKSMLKWVKAFQKCDLYSKTKDCPALEEVQEYYKAKVKKYFPDDVRW